MAHLKKSILINKPVDKVYARARDPRGWPTWYAGTSEIEELAGEGEAGTVAKLSYMMAGVRLPVTVRVLEDTINPEGAHWEGKIEGPLDGKQTWIYTPKEGGTEVSVEMEYKVPGKALGKIADRLFIERLEERSTEHTLEKLKMLCESE